MKIYDIIYVIVVAIIEGITEWLPISSTAHLIIFSKLFSFLLSNEIFTSNFLDMFDVVIQLGAIIAVIIIFFSELNPFKGGKEKIILWLKIIIATIPVVVFTLIFNDKMVDIYNLRTISFTLIFYGIIFIVVEKITKDKFKITSIGEISYLKALFIGVIQILAIIPGTSRSGITIICGMLLGFDRKMAAKFSFFLSIPVMFGASSLKIFEYVTNDFFTNNQIVLLLLGLTMTLIISLFIVRFLIDYTSRHSLKHFAWYRISLGIFIILCILFNVF